MHLKDDICVFQLISMSTAPDGLHWGSSGLGKNRNQKKHTILATAKKKGNEPINAWNLNVGICPALCVYILNILRGRKNLELVFHYSECLISQDACEL